MNMPDEYAWKLAERLSSVPGGGAPEAFISSPGRTELGGNHTDHQHGRVLAAAVTLSLYAAARETSDGMLRVYSDGMPDVEIELTDLAPRPAERNGSAALVRGIAAGFKAKGLDSGARGLTLSVCGDVPVGSGLSSSASFELLVAKAVDELLFGGETPHAELARIAQRAENEYFGKPCGLMDQLACALGGVSAMDFAEPDSPRTSRVPLDLDAFGYSLCLVNSGGGHEDLTDEYAAVPADMFAVAHALGKNALRDVPEHMFMRSLPELRSALGDRAVLRAMHFYAEDRRAAAEAEALVNGDFAKFLELVRASGRSSAMYLQNLAPAGETRSQPMLVAQALCERELSGRGAVRVHGGGFAGSLLAFVPEDAAARFINNIDAALGSGSCVRLYIRDAGPQVRRA